LGQSVEAVYNCWFGLKRANAAIAGQTVYIQAGLIVLCYAALIGLRNRDLFATWAFLVALSALLSRSIALWVNRKQSPSAK
jgi:hypothetical protein